MKELPPGLRFYPTEEELVSFYIPAKIEGKKQNLDLVIPVLHIYDFQPWDLPKYAGELCRKDPEQWFFFIRIQEKEARGGRPNRLTEIGYWKATGSPGYVYSSDNRIIGEKKTMVFYEGRAPNGKKTNWKMNEYKAIEGEFSSSSETPKLRQEFSLCRVYKSSKCLRAYDRRPPATLPVSETAYNQALEDDFEKAMPRKGKFSESSPVAENFLERTHADNHCSSAATKNMDSVLNENNIWEWDQVNYGTFWGTYGEMFLVQ